MALHLSLLFTAKDAFSDFRASFDSVVSDSILLMNPDSAVRLEN